VLTHRKLKVYEKALAFASTAPELSTSWGSRPAIGDQFRRASESIVLNLAEGARLVGGPSKARALDYALGSSLECAACLDIAHIRGCLDSESITAEKARVLEIARMLIGLRKAWLDGPLREEPAGYQVRAPGPGLEVGFHHESLEVYKVALDFMRWFVLLPGAKELADRACREVDKSGTSLLLNIAEGNGRYSELDQRRFLEIAAASAVRAAVYLDLYQPNTPATKQQTNPGQELLGRITAMLSRF
jgi:four helix bundle protein